MADRDDKFAWTSDDQIEIVELAPREDDDAEEDEQETVDD